MRLVCLALRPRRLSWIFDYITLHYIALYPSLRDLTWLDRVSVISYLASYHTPLALLHSLLSSPLLSK